MQVVNYNEALNFTVACCKKKHLFNVADVVRLEASSNYTLIHTVNSRPLVVAKVLAAYAEVLEGLGFVRVHRSHLVNRRFIHKVNGKGLLRLIDNSTIEIPRRKKKSIMEKLVS